MTSANVNGSPSLTQPGDVVDEQPTTHEWRHLLLRIQWLFMKGQFKQCLLECSNLLIESESKQEKLYATYLHFYVAIAWESIARGLSPFTSARVDALAKAREQYEEARQSFPAPATFLSTNDPAVEDLDPAISEAQSTSSDANMNEQRDQSTPNQSCYSPSSLQSDGYIADTMFPKPPTTPTVCTTISEGGQTSSATEASQTHQNPPHHIPQRSTEFTGIWLRNRSAESFNAHLEDFRSLLDRHIDTIDALIQSNEEMMSSRSTKGWRARSIYEHTELKPINIGDRICRLRAAGWHRERFDASRYQKLCEQAVADL